MMEKDACSIAKINNAERCYGDQEKPSDEEHFQRNILEWAENSIVSEYIMHKLPSHLFSGTVYSLSNFDPDTENQDNWKDEGHGALQHQANQGTM